MYKLIKNAKILTMDKQKPYAQAALVANEYFAYVGSEKGAREFLAERDLTAQEWDAKGHTVLPGFNDAHLHLLHCLKAKDSVDLFSCQSFKELMATMNEAYENHNKDSGSWLIGEGWNQDYFSDEKRFPLGKDLDKISRDIPIVIMRACFHIGVLNSKAMELIGITKEKASDHYGYIDVDEKKNPTGVIREYVLDNIKAKLPSPSVEDLVEKLIDFQEDLFEQGITSVQSDDVKYLAGENYPRFCYLMREAGEKKRLKLRYSLQLLVDNKEDIEQFFALGFDKDFGNRRFKISSIKILTDGSLGARTAYLRKPYSDDPSTRGIALYKQNELNHMVYSCHKENMPVALHAIGDGAIEQCLEAISYAQEQLPHLHPRHGLVHAQITDKDLLRRIKKLKIGLYIQPIFLHYDMHMVKSRVGGALAQSSYAWKTCRDMGIPCAYSTDAPVEPFKTMPNLYCAVTRRDLQARGPFLPEEKVSVEEALEAYTLLGAYMTAEEEDKGKIKEGYLADFIILDRSITEVEKKEILATRVMKTFLGGQVVYKRG